MNEKKQNQDEYSQGFFDRPQTIKWILRVFYAICILLVIADFVVHRHIETAIEKTPAFYAIYGFVACVILVLIATQMRKVLMRDEHYYENLDAQIHRDTAERDKSK
jgi:hypothetical protein